jgi:hypothetical protein
MNMSGFLRSRLISDEPRGVLTAVIEGLGSCLLSALSGRGGTGGRGSSSRRDIPTNVVSDLLEPLVNVRCRLLLRGGNGRTS